MNAGAGTPGLAFTITSDDIAAYSNFDYNMVALGPRREIHAERQWLESMCREEPDILIGWHLSKQQANNALSLRQGPNPIVSGTDGEFDVATNEFRTIAVALSNARMGKMVEITAANSPPVVRGFYRLLTRVTGDRAIIDGIVPTNATGLIFNIWEPGDMSVVLESL